MNQRPLRRRMDDKRISRPTRSMSQNPIRKDIQALRGIAVALVVLFHLGLIGSGFLGVDVFFVVSGYLMAQLYDPAAKFGFYARRARRLLPAYFATVIATLLAALAITVPSDFSQVVTQSFFAAGFASN